MDQAAKLQAMLAGSDNIVFFGGAGVSTESGIPDFRSVDGLYSQQYAYPPEVMLSHSFYVSHTDEFYAFYKAKLLAPGAKPNKAHIRLAEWERTGKVKAVITQNIDGLHQAAGSKTVLELHGSVKRNYCSRCKAFYDEQFIIRASGVPTCSCGGTVKPDVVLYEEGLDMGIMQQATAFIANADVLIVAGTSLVVYPAAGLIDYYRGNKLVLINRAPTSADGKADLLIQGSVGEVLGMVSL
ncbi:NAD-dependent protein deacylase [Acetonema longum]|uniref:NAD-dependent protein deacetylase n=1 Tax=Acetonema longum DSM 6540 TaxID=1009370 RepID=F7NIY0_9FIRM|nr:NAD-dependent protein deacylase [Acetonema longum]EGO63977.1 NAD-dependent deacetylase [Acetonema longum DSM 6540]